MPSVCFESSFENAIGCASTPAGSRPSDEISDRRAELIQSSVDRPLERLVSLLLYVAQDNARHGRDSHVIADDIRCGVVADYLQLSIDDLAANLIVLQQADLIRATEAGVLELLDLCRLEHIANASLVH